MKITIIVVIIIVMMTIAAMIIAITVSYYIDKIWGIFKNRALKKCSQKHHQIKCSDNSEWISSIATIN